MNPAGDIICAFILQSRAHNLSKIERRNTEDLRMVKMAGMHITSNQVIWQ